MKELLDRLKSESPDFFKSLRKYAYSLVALASAIVAVDAVNPEALAILPAKIVDISYLIGALAAGIGVTTHLPVKTQDQDEQKKP